MDTPQTTPDRSERSPDEPETKGSSGGKLIQIPMDFLRSALRNPPPRLPEERLLRQTIRPEDNLKPRQETRRRRFDSENERNDSSPWERTLKMGTPDFSFPASSSTEESPSKQPAQILTPTESALPGIHQRRRLLFPVVVLCLLGAFSAGALIAILEKDETEESVPSFSEPAEFSTPKTTTSSPPKTPTPSPQETPADPNGVIDAKELMQLVEKTETVPEDAEPEATKDPEEETTALDTSSLTTPARTEPLVAKASTAPRPSDTPAPASKPPQQAQSSHAPDDSGESPSQEKAAAPEADSVDDSATSEEETDGAEGRGGEHESEASESIKMFTLRK